mmetsp:Transcript_11188/g.16977  ORF Transcript_11188/g.16977 Transcript_11188/m.16977 type:complete len:136 (+) Transcript_11188:161-568(+)
MPLAEFRLEKVKDSGKKADSHLYFRVKCPKMEGLLGGKGGFGSLLRSIKAKQSELSQNMDACRDLNTGRRLGQVQQQERLREWHRKKEEEDKFVEEELRRYEESKLDLRERTAPQTKKIDNALRQTLDEGSSSMA